MDWLRLSFMIIIGFHFSVACIIGLILLVKNLVENIQDGDYGLVILDIFFSMVLSVLFCSGLYLLITTLK